MSSGKSFDLSLVVKAIDKATGPLGKIEGAIGGLAKGAMSAGKGLSLALTAPLAAMGTASLIAFGQFEAGMANVSTLVDTNAENMDAMGKRVLEISRRTPVALGDLTAALYEARSAGVSAADQFTVLEGSARLAVVGLGTTKEAIDLVTSSVNAFGLKGSEATGIYNVLFQATNTGKTTVAGLAQGFGGVAGTVANAGIKIDEYLASVAAMTTTGLPASEAHTQLRAVISGLTRDSKSASTVFRKLGAKDFKDLIAKSGGLVPALDKVKGVLGGSDKAMLKLLGSTEALNAAIGLTGGQAGAYRQTLEAMRAGGDAVGAAFEKQNKTSAATMQRLRNSLEGVGVSIGRILVPALERLAPMLESAATAWEGLGSNTQTSIVVLAGAAAALGPTLMVISNLATVVGTTGKAISFMAGWAQYLWMMRASILAGLVPSLTAASASVWAFTAALLANPITWIVVGIAALAGAAYLVYKNWEPIQAFFIGLWDSVTQAFRTAWDAIRPIVDKVMAFQDFIPLGGLLKMGVQGVDNLLAADAGRPSVGAAQAAPLAGPLKSEARVQVDFANLPRGARVTPERDNTAALDYSLGYSMVGG